jgi:phosphoesterase RecJ-like protein
MIPAQSLSEGGRLLRQAERPLLITHVAPDGDAVGSLLGLGWMLQALDKRPLLACQDPVPPRYRYLPGWEQVVQQVPHERFDLWVVLDSSDTERLGTVAQADWLADIPLLNIDHHVTNLRFGTLNLVDEAAASTTQILYDLAGCLPAPLDEPTAVCLLTGLVTDTRGFRTANVTPEALEVAVALMRAGASLAAITRNGLDRRSLPHLRLWGAGLTRVQASDGLVWTAISLAEQQQIGYDARGDFGLANLLIGVEGALMAAVFTEREGGQVEVALRAAPGFDVSGLALALGGGGHPLAAGCTLPGSLKAVKRRVLTAMRQSLDRQRERAR